MDTAACEMHRASVARTLSPQKKMKLRGTKDLSIATVGKYGTLQEFSFFDKVSGETSDFWGFPGPGWPLPAQI